MSIVDEFDEPVLRVPAGSVLGTRTLSVVRLTEEGTNNVLSAIPARSVDQGCVV